MPGLIGDLLSSRWFSLAARVILTSFFWLAGLFGLFNFGTMEKTIAGHGLPGPSVIVAAMIVTELGGSLLLITDVASLGWLGAGWLGIFTLLSIPLGHPFWKHNAPKRMDEFQIAAEHVGIIGGLMCAAILTTM